MKTMTKAILVITLVMFLAGNAWTQSENVHPKKAFGLRAGYGTKPDQIVFGAQAILGRTLNFMRFAPSIDIGTGDDMTTYLFNGDFRVLHFSPPGSPAGLYAGAGGSLAIFDTKNFGSDTEIGVNIVTGLTFPMGKKNEYNVEVRFGLADMPDLRILFGIMLGARSNPGM